MLKKGSKRMKSMKVGKVGKNRQTPRYITGNDKIDFAVENFFLNPLEIYIHLKWRV